MLERHVQPANHRYEEPVMIHTPFRRAFASAATVVAVLSTTVLLIAFPVHPVISILFGIMTGVQSGFIGAVVLNFATSGTTLTGTVFDPGNA